jgi:site-specific recombinase XerD
MNSSFSTFLNEYQGSAATKKAYSVALSKFEKFLSNNEPTERKVEQFMLDLERKGLTSATVNLYLSAIRSYFLWRKKQAPPEKRGLFDLMVKGPKIHSKLPRMLPAENVSKITSACETPYETALVMTLFDGALRINELMGLQTSDIDSHKNLLRITQKGGDEAMVPVSEKTIKALKTFIGNREGLVFTGNYWAISRLLRKVANRAGVRDLHPHQLRHARAQSLRSQGIAIQDIQGFLRHKQITTTMRYAQIDPIELQKKIPRAF